MANAASETQTEVGHEAGAQPGFPPFDPATFPSQLVWLAIIFGALYYYMSKKILPRVGKVISDRHAAIARDLDEATKQQQKADEAHAAHEKSLAEARARAQALAQAKRDQLAAEAEAKRKTVVAELGAKLAAAEAEIAAIRAQAMANVADIAAETTSAIVERLIGRSVEPATIASAVAAAKTN